MAGTTPKPFVFVLMPFSGDFDDIYKVGIISACKEAGAYCERVDHQIFTESILERIYNQIAKADIVVSDMTGRNPNVFYETGYAHALGKPTILLTQKADDIPFDLKHYPHIVYEGKITKLKTELKKRVSHFIKHPDKKNLATSEMFKFLINGNDVRDSPSISLTFQDYDLTNGWLLSFAIQNLSNRVIDFDEINFGLVFPKTLGEPFLSHEEFIIVDDKHYMYYSTHMLPARFLPKSWNHRSIKIRNKQAEDFHKIPTLGPPKFPPTFAHNSLIKIFGEFETKDIPFVIWTQPR